MRNDVMARESLAPLLLRLALGAILMPAVLFLLFDKHDIATWRIPFFAVGVAGTLWVLDAEKGTEVQSLPLGKNIKASPAVADGCLVIGTTDGMLYCLGKK